MRDISICCRRACRSRRIPCRCHRCRQLRYAQQEFIRRFTVLSTAGWLSSLYSFVANCHQYARFWHAATTYASHFWHSLKVCALFNSYIFYTESSTHGIFAKVLTIL